MAKEDKVNYLPSAFHLGTQRVLSEYMGIKDMLQMRLNKSSEYNLQLGKHVRMEERSQQGLLGRTSQASFGMKGGYIQAKCSRS